VTTKKLLIAAASAAAMTSAAHAGGGDWSGFYAGLNVGYGWGSAPSDITLGGSWAGESVALRTGVTNLWSTTLKPKGVDYGVQAGYNFDFGGWVLGGELDYKRRTADDSRLLSLTPTSFGPIPTYGPGNSIDIDHTLALKARLGFDAGGFLLYGTGGWSMTRATGTTEVTSSQAYSKFGSDSEWVSGWVYGAGVEKMIGANWSARVEYLRGTNADFEFATAYRAGSTFAPPAANYTEIVKQDLSTNSVRLGVNFHF
jgi:outer membrane immunogenic protein